MSKILILADIEGSSGCWSYQASAFRTEQWARACLEMTKDVDAVAKALADRGAGQVIIQDFHRTGYNLLAELVDGRAVVRSGYRSGPVPGVGHPAGSRILMMLGMHAASGTPGFLAHTLTSRLEAVLVDGRHVAEAELFAAALAPYRLRPVFFSGCPVACRQAAGVLPGITTFAIDKEQGPGRFNAVAWRAKLAEAAICALDCPGVQPYRLTGPIRAEVVFSRGSQAARQAASRWRLSCRGASVFLEAAHMADLYRRLVHVCYLTPMVKAMLPLAIALANFKGRLGLKWVRRKLRAWGQLPGNG